MYGNKTNHTQRLKIIKKNISHTPCRCLKITGKTFSSDLRKACLITGKSLSPLTKISSVCEKYLTTNPHFVRKFYILWTNFDYNILLQYK